MRRRSIGNATTVNEARAIEEAGVDMLVATGAEAGGHFTRPSPTGPMMGNAEDDAAVTRVHADRYSFPNGLAELSSTCCRIVSGARHGNR